MTQRVVLFMFLFAVAVPWYWQPLRLTNRLVFGFPPWFVVAIAGSLMISLLACWYLREPWSREVDEAESD